MTERSLMPVTKQRASRALGLGSRHQKAIAGALLLLVVATLVLLAASRMTPATGPPARAGSPPRPPTGGGSAARASHPKVAQTAARSDIYGGLPSWLPKAKIRVGRTAHATAAHPWLAIEGDTVLVQLASSHHVLATAVGPQVPETGHFPIPRTSPCRFLITFTAATRPIPLKPSAFTIRDELGQVHHPRVTTLAGRLPPAVLRPGSTITLAATDVLPTGNGRLRWAPAAKPIVSWDFDVEID